MRRRAGRAWLAAAGILAAALVVGTTLTVSVSLSGGFGRAADRADLPDLTVKFDERSREDVVDRLGSLPNLQTLRFRTELTRVRIEANGKHSHRGAIHVVEPGRRGYAIVSGRDVRGEDEVVVERGVAREWDVALGDTVRIFDDGELRVVGIGLSPDNVAFPLAAVPRVYVDARAIDPRFRPLPVNVALAWLNDEDREDVTLAQARAVSFGLADLSFATRAGLQVLIGQAAGIVIALLIAFSLVAVATAGVMLGASARSEVARRLPSLGVERAVGFSRGAIVLAQARRGALVAAPAAAAGLAIGAFAVAGPSDDLLAALNEVGPGSDILWWLAGAWLGIVALVAAASAWPAWRAMGAPVAALLRGGELATSARLRSRRRREIAPEAQLAGRSRPSGLLALGARLAAARRGRWGATVVVLAAAAATLLLLLSLASLLVALRDDPGTVGKRYAFTAQIGEEAVPDIKRLPGVADAAPRWRVDGSAAFALGQQVRVVAFPSGDEEFEAPPLAEGRRRSAPDEAEVGVGLADALGLSPGATLAVALPGGEEVRLRVAGVVRALENEGRVAFVRSEPLAARGILGDPQVAVRLTPGADRGRVSRGLRELGARPSEATAATTKNRAFLGVLATVLRIVALTVGLVCLVVLAQTLVLTARERRQTLALLRTVGGGRAALIRVLGGACAVVLVPAALLGVALEWLVLGPAVASLAAGYAGLALTPSAGQVALALGALVVLGAIAVVWVAARVERQAVVTGLREEA